MDPKRASWVTTIALILLLAGLAFYSRGCPTPVSPPPPHPPPVAREPMPEPPAPPPLALPPPRAEPVPVPAPKPAAPPEDVPIIPPPDPDTLGAIEGTVRFVGTAPEREMLDMRAEPLCAERYPNGLPTEDLSIDKGGIAWAVVSLDGTYASWDSKKVVPQPRAVSISGCRFSPHVVDVFRGSPLKFLNEDKVAHVLYMLGPDRRKSWTITLGGGETSSIAPKLGSGFERIYCDLHPWESAWVASMQTQYYAITDKQGRYRIENIPRGSYQVVVWQERCLKDLGVPVPKDVRVQPGKTWLVDFNLKLAR